MGRFKEINKEVLFNCGIIAAIQPADIEFLKSKAAGNQRKRSRICLHRNIEDRLHEMIIVLSKGNYIRPHKHHNKSESFHIIEGKLKVVVFEDDGRIKDVIEMSPHPYEGSFYYRLDTSLFHTVIPLSAWTVFHEVTNGPFDKADTVFASWAPMEQERELADEYLQVLTNELTKING